jgi:hypothetical protein
MFFKLPKGRRAPVERAKADVNRIGMTDTFRASGRMPGVEVALPFFTHLHMEDGPMFDPYKIPGSRSLHERKLATWALLIGETYSSAVHAEERRRPHRGMLPDVDFSRAVPDHSRPTLVRRIIRLIRPGDRNRASTSLPSESCNEPVGEKPAKPYIARSGAGDTSDSVSPTRDAARPQSLARQSRAA